MLIPVCTKRAPRHTMGFFLARFLSFLFRSLALFSRSLALFLSRSGFLTLRHHLTHACARAHFLPPPGFSLSPSLSLYIYRVQNPFGDVGEMQTFTHCNTVTHCNTPQHTATKISWRWRDLSRLVQHTATHCNTLQHTTHCNTLQHCLSRLNVGGLLLCLPAFRELCVYYVSDSVLQRVAVCCSVPQSVAMFCSVLECVAVCCSVL